MAKKKRNPAEVLKAEQEFIQEAKPKKKAPAPSKLTESVSSRIDPKLALRLRKAMAARSITREFPYKKQDILAAAISEWCDRNNY